MYLITEDVEDLKHYFINYLDDDINPLFTNIIRALKDTNSCIAGGSLLSYVNNDPINDIDIYVPTKKYIQFLQILTKDIDPIYKVTDVLNVKDKNVSSKYDESFFKKIK